jgi:hypothetical protein
MHSVCRNQPANPKIVCMSNLARPMPIRPRVQFGQKWFWLLALAFFFSIGAGQFPLKGQTHDLLNLPGGSGSNPQELSAFLKRLGIRSNPASNRLLNELLQKGTGFLEDLPKEQRDRLEQLARDYMRRNSSGAGDDLEGSLPEMLRELKKFQDLGGQLPDELAPIGEGFDEIAESIVGGQFENGSEALPDDGNRSGKANNSDAGRDSGKRNENDKSVGGTGKNSNRPQPVEPSIPEQANKPNTEENESLDSKRKPDRDESNPPVGAKTGGNRSDNNSGSEESVGKRFDRMIMDAIEKGISERESAEKGGIAGSFDSLLDSLAKNIDKAIDRNRQREGNNRRGNERNNNRQGNDGQSGEGNSWFSGSDPGSLLAAPVQWLGHWRWLTVLAAAILAFWLLRKLAGTELGERISGRDRPRYRHAPLRSARQLVESVDRFMLARFGRGADWWTVRRAQAELQNQDMRRVSDSRLDELASAYERARYSPGDMALDTRLLQEASDTLKDLAVDLLQKPVPATASGAKP